MAAQIKLSKSQEYTMEMLRDNWVVVRHVRKDGSIDNARYREIGTNHVMYSRVPSTATINALLKKGLVKARILEKTPFGEYNEEISLK